MRPALAAGLALVALPVAAALPPGDPQRGKAIYGRCEACHALAYDRVGPHHCGLFGRHAGSVPGFNYSPAMKHSGIVWNAETLNRFLAAPTRVVPGTTMTYAGISEPQERADLIAWLKVATASPELCPRR